MSFCTNCGSKLVDGAKFCMNCGSTTLNHFSEDGSTRQTVYEGVIHKCPNCGDVLESFRSNCPSCGYEIRNTSATNSVVSFYNDLVLAETTEQRNYLIRNFPIPNSKEDIMEFMLLTSSNIWGEDNKDISESWMAKFDLCYQKALLVLKNDDDLNRVQQIYRDCQSKFESEKNRKKKKLTLEAVANNILVGIGFLIMMIAVKVEKSDDNSSIYQLIALIIWLTSAATLFKRKASLIDYLVATASGLLAIFVSFLFQNGSVDQLCGGIILIIVAINYIKSLVTK